MKQGKHLIFMYLLLILVPSRFLKFQTTPVTLIGGVQQTLAPGPSPPSPPQEGRQGGQME